MKSRFKHPVALVALLGLTLSSCMDPEDTTGEAIRLTWLCSGNEAYTDEPNYVSFVFKAEGEESGKPVTDLDSTDPAILFSISDGGDSTGAESAAQAIGRPQNVAKRTLLLVDGSGSLYDPERKSEATIKQALRDFVRSSDLNNHLIGIYKFYGGGAAGRFIEPIHAFDASKNTLEAIERDITKDILVREGASTALYGASLSALNLLREQTDPAASVLVRTLVLFTDGRDEVYSGAQREQKRREVESAYESFRNEGGQVLTAGISGQGTADTGFLNAIASRSGSVSETDLTKLSGIFTRFAEEAASEAKKYYQFNMCSNRRFQKVQASLLVEHPEFAESALEFSYSANDFQDPTTSSDIAACRPEGLKARTNTCNWSDRETPRQSPNTNPENGEEPETDPSALYKEYQLCGPDRSIRVDRGMIYFNPGDPLEFEQSQEGVCSTEVLTSGPSKIEFLNYILGAENMLGIQYIDGEGNAQGWYSMLPRPEPYFVVPAGNFVVYLAPNASGQINSRIRLRWSPLN